MLPSVAVVPVGVCRLAIGLITPAVEQSKLLAIGAAEAAGAVDCSGPLLALAGCLM